MSGPAAQMTRELPGGTDSDLRARKSEPAVGEQDERPRGVAALQESSLDPRAHERVGIRWVAELSTPWSEREDLAVEGHETCSVEATIDEAGGAARPSSRACVSANWALRS